MLSFGYTLLTNNIFSMVNVVGLDPYVGFLHTEKHGKPSLVLDIVDAIVLKLINNYSLTMDDFKKDLDTYYLSESGKKVFLKEYETRKNTEIKHPLFGYKTTYKHCFELQVRLFSKYLIGEVDKYIPFIWR
ncbi:MAG: CRISPR-associated endonuclease Cas1 [Methanosarcinales archaeon]